MTLLRETGDVARATNADDEGGRGEDGRRAALTPHADGGPASAAATTATDATVATAPADPTVTGEEAHQVFAFTARAADSSSATGST